MHTKSAIVMLFVCLAALVAAAIVASRVQSSGGRVQVSNVTYDNEFGTSVRAKLFKPSTATAARPAPGVVFIHGYQSVREMGDSFGIELSRRGMVVLAIDAIGRGNSGVPGSDVNAPTFDHTFGGRASFAYLGGLDFVDSQRTGFVGHSLGASMAYKVALENEKVRALVILGAAYNEEASFTRPKNMLMIIGRFDEFRHRMTGTEDIEAEWMSKDFTRTVIPDGNPQFATTYGSFEQGTARRVVVPASIHIQETHHKEVVAETLNWLNNALQPPKELWSNPADQIWAAKEWATLVAMLAAFAALLPLVTLLLKHKFFSSLKSTPSEKYSCSARDLVKHGTVNGLLMWLYLPCALMVFAVHKYVVPIDGALPMMVVNVIAWWFLLINFIGFLLFRRWYKKKAREEGLTLFDLGISWREESMGIGRRLFFKSVLLAAVLFGVLYGTEHLLEALLIVDYRFVFAFANDLTPYRAWMALLYFPAFFLGFVQLGFFLFGQLRLRAQKSFLRTFLHWSGVYLAVLLLPLILLWAVQYVPLLTSLAIPFVGPGGILALFMINAMHIVGVLILIIPLSTWIFQLTGRPYVGAILSAAIVAWMFASSQVIAPVPI